MESTADELLSLIRGLIAEDRLNNHGKATDIGEAFTALDAKIMSGESLPADWQAES